MKIKHKYPPQIDEIRIRTGFLWFPKTLEFQTRWLEVASWEEEYNWVYDGGFYWEPLRWVNDKKE